MVTIDGDGLTRERPLSEFGVFSKDRLVGPDTTDVLGGRLALFLKNVVPRVDRRGIRLLDSLVAGGVGRNALINVLATGDRSDEVIPHRVNRVADCGNRRVGAHGDYTGRDQCDQRGYRLFEPLGGYSLRATSTRCIVLEVSTHLNHPSLLLQLSCISRPKTSFSHEAKSAYLSRRVQRYTHVTLSLMNALRFNFTLNFYGKLFDPCLITISTCGFTVMLSILLHTRKHRAFVISG